MLVFKYSKLKSVRFISHIELLRHMGRVMRRADIPVNFSLGFNPHALMFFSPPMGLGTGSTAEYLTIDSPLKKEDGIVRFNGAVPEGLYASECFEVQKNPNLQGKIVASDYLIPTEFDGIKIGKDYFITYDKKGETVTENISDKIFAVFEKDGKLAMRLATGNINLRADRVVAQLNKDFELNIVLTDVVKFAQFVRIDGALVDVDEYLLTLNIDTATNTKSTLQLTPQSTLNIDTATNTKSTLQPTTQPTP